MLIQSHILGLALLFSGVPIFFSQKIQINGLNWMVCDPGVGCICLGFCQNRN